MLYIRDFVVPDILFFDANLIMNDFHMRLRFLLFYAINPCFGGYLTPSP